MQLNFSKTPIGKLRLVGFAEGISLLVLLFIAMPLKYIAHIPEAVKVVGWLHGVLFILYMIALLKAWAIKKWSIGFAVLAFVASLVPFGTFVLDSRLRKEDETSS